MKKCPYCGQQSIVTVPYQETIMFGDRPILQDGWVEHCTNPHCIEPNRFTAEQRKQLDEQLQAQLDAMQ